MRVLRLGQSTRISVPTTHLCVVLQVCKLKSGRLKLGSLLGSLRRLKLMVSRLCSIWSSRSPVVLLVNGRTQYMKSAGLSPTGCQQVLLPGLQNEPLPPFCEAL